MAADGASLCIVNNRLVALTKRIASAWRKPRKLVANVVHSEVEVVALLYIVTAWSRTQGMGEQ